MCSICMACTKMRSATALTGFPGWPDIERAGRFVRLPLEPQRRQDHAPSRIQIVFGLLPRHIDEREKRPACRVYPEATYSQIAGTRGACNRLIDTLMGTKAIPWRAQVAMGVKDRLLDRGRLRGLDPVRSIQLSTKSKPGMSRSYGLPPMHHLQSTNALPVVGENTPAEVRKLVNTQTATGISVGSNNSRANCIAFWRGAVWTARWQ